MKTNTLDTNIIYRPIYVTLDGDILKWKTVKAHVAWWCAVRLPYYRAYSRYVLTYGRKPLV